MNKPRIISAEEAFDNGVALYVEKYGDVDEYSTVLDQIISGIKEGSRVADVACGPGNLSKYIQGKTSGLSFDFYDLSQAMLKYCKSQFPDASIFKKDMLSISKAAKVYDVILCGFGIPYIKPDATRQFIGDSFKLLNSEGYFYLSFMEESNDAFKMVTSSNGEFAVATYFYSFNSIRKMLSDSGFNIITSLKLKRKDSIDHCVLALKP